MSRPSKLFNSISAIPADLRPEVERSFQVPQCGPHHREGGFLLDHLELVLVALEGVQQGEFPSSVPDEIRPGLTRVAIAHAELASLYVLLHDLDKANAMTLIFADGRERAVAWTDWQDLIAVHPRAAEINDRNADALAEMLRHHGIAQISYFQKLADGSVQMHGKMAATRLEKRGDIPGIVCRAIDTHEIAYQFAARGGVNIPLFRKVFGGWSPDELAFALLVNLADQMGSHGEAGADIAPFLLLAQTAGAAGVTERVS